MIKYLLLLFLPIMLWGQDVKVTAEIDQRNIGENIPFKGTITVTHPEDLEIDTQSFKLGNKPIQVDFIRDVKLSPTSPLTLSIFEFPMEGKDKGLHFLPEISVKVGPRSYKSISTTYEISGKETRQVTKQQKRVPTKFDEVILTLEALVEGDTPIYPKQRIKLIYRYIFNRDIELIDEELPLLEAKGFRKIGSKKVKDYTHGELNIREVSQEVEALKPGDYTFGPSVIKGYEYKQDLRGRRTYIEPQLVSEAPDLTVKVLPLPDEEQPPSYNGAVGDYTFTVKLLTPKKMNVGDKIELAIDITGKGELENVPPPDLCCQPGFSGVFRVSDLPPVGQVRGSTKHYIIELRPLSATTREIPPVHFSFFNPQNQEYKELKSQPIPIQVLPITEEAPEGLVKDIKEEPFPEPKLKAIEIEGNFPLSSSDISNRPFGTWWVVLLIPFGILLIIIQIRLKKKYESQKKIVLVKTSQDFFEEALNQEKFSSEYFVLLRKAFMTKLTEVGEIKNIKQNLPNTQRSQKVREFFTLIEEKRFTGNLDYFNDSFEKKVHELFEEIKS